MRSGRVESVESELLSASAELEISMNSEATIITVSLLDMTWTEQFNIYIMWFSNTFHLPWYLQIFSAIKKGTEAIEIIRKEDLSILVRAPKTTNVDSDAHTDHSNFTVISIGESAPVLRFRYEH